MAEEATVEGPPRRRASWSLKAIVEDVAGRPIAELQDPSRPVHPYLEGKITKLPPRPSAAVAAEEYDPVGHLYPPLVGAAGRSYHGAAHEHHRETIERHGATVEAVERSGGRRPGPTRRPERIYLHYLLLHLDRLNDAGLRYLRVAIDEELAHRAANVVRAAGAPTVDDVPVPEPPV